MENRAVFTGHKQPILPKLQHCIKKAKKIYFIVSFIRDSGMKLLIKTIKEAGSEGKEIKIITSNYLNITEPNALYRLYEVFEKDKNIKIFNNSSISFHPKTYIFEYENGEGEVLVGSSNISYSALMSGVEWNYAFKKSSHEKEYYEFLNEFEELYEKNSVLLTLEWLRKYEQTYRKNKDIIDVVPPKLDLEPIKFQIPALYELSKTREEGHTKAMVTVATGLGKTYLGAFDSLNYKKILFVAHNIEILEQARLSFLSVHKGKTAAFFTGDKKSMDGDILFATIQTLGKKRYLNEEYFPKDHFDYIIVDEFHHADAPTYRRLIDYFEPEFLLGLTATPDRSDNGDIYEICDYNIAYECNFRTGINNGWLVPFEYYGIYDDVDYSSIPWRSGKYDLEALENKLMIEDRSEEILKKYKTYGKNKTIGFCASVKHAKHMEEYFKKNKVRCASILGETSKNDRTQIIKDFRKGDLKLIFVVDVFNEGVDIPDIETVMFLRPTTSYTIFIQQLGRGLRTSEGKDKLRVLDFVGNYKGSHWKPLFLTGNYNPKDPKQKTGSAIDMDLPQGCQANFDLKLIDYLEQERVKKEPLKEKLIHEFFRMESELNKIPSMMDVEARGKYPVDIYIKTFKSWLNFLVDIERADPNELKMWKINIGKDFLSFLEKTAMTKSYKIPTLLSFIEGEQPIGEVSSTTIGENFSEFYSNKLHGKDLNNKKHKNWDTWNIKDFEKLAVENPIKFLSKSSSQFFTYDGDKRVFYLNKKLYEMLKDNKEIIKKIKDRLEYRKTSYFKRKYGEE
ncbi:MULTISPECIES: DEAD/DEAH box helicase family protein [Psychrilyobacter]|uniref:Restriction endonuclease subunit R n=1 Tax=Psychrilyobacter piezotolerans TaxID=2293438 RepID=A0ABX9KIF6_9FUSO|nr:MULTISPECIES: DEAD/DEAH box helicase family protein [Psychrilyobacter]MCS5420625.1 DEAD/DEAH box helicase family protein [Psychrilyobacter sp. S5]NDI77356.1 DEAD/DEAH box helicase family protein [Psychrilyobacter piezotolerans]RDE63663.1 restriction endonuclease subunit R [Psychrilyobacter sp. S5]REI42007.1 restriction endonuclease subunit R [Psychrilyobacter piezotolerans]